MLQAPFTPEHQPPRDAVRFCRHCGHAVQQAQLPDDCQPRAVCPACGTIHYINPLLVVGTIPIWQGQVLLCKRNIEPRKGLWTLPAGFMEMGETTAQGAARETVEEAGAQFDMGRLFSIINVAAVGQVHLFYRCALRSAVFVPGPETAQAQLFAPADIPWAALAFTTVRLTLQAYFANGGKDDQTVLVHDVN